MIQSQQMQDGGVDVMDVDRILHRREAQVVRPSNRLTGPDAAPGEPHGVGVDVVVASDGVPFLPHGSPAELSSPDHQGGVQESPLFQVPDQGRGGAVGLPGDLVQPLLQVHVGVSVMVPLGVVELDETDPPLHQAPGQQAVVGE